MTKVRIDARDVLNDIRSGLDDTALMKKYRLSGAGLQSLFSKLTEAGLIKVADLEKRMPNFEKTVELTMVKCPSCGMPQFSAFDECPQCGVIVKKFLEGREPPKRDVKKIVGKQPRPESAAASPKESAEAKNVRISAFLWEKIKALGGNPDEHVTRAISMYVLRNKEKPSTE